MAATTPEKTYTIDQFISCKNTDKNIYYSNLSIFEKSIDGTQLLLSYNILNDYYDEIFDKAVTVELTDKEYNMYQYQPKKLAYKLYGSTEYYYILLFLNGMASVKEFNRKKIKLIRPSDLSSILSAIYTSEEDFLINNQNLLEEIEKE